MNEITIQSVPEDVMQQASDGFTACPSSGRIELLIDALAKAQAEFGPIEKDKTAKIMSAKGNYAYSYADLATVLAVVRPVLAKHGIALFQPVTMHNGTVNIKTVLAHRSGQWLSDEIGFKSGEGDPRSVASVITYGRRYGLTTMIGVAPSDEDDDGAAVTASVAKVGSVSEPAPSRKPAGFDEWLSALTFEALGGSVKLRAAWREAKQEFRDYLTVHEPKTLADLKERGKQSDLDALERSAQ